MTTSTIITEIDAFVAAQNKYRGGAIAGGGTLPEDYNALSAAVPAGGNAVSGIAGIAAGATGISFSSGIGDAVLLDGANSTSASSSGPDNYTFAVDMSGKITVTDLNTGKSETITGANYLVFNGGATNADGSFKSIYLARIIHQAA